MANFDLGKLMEGKNPQAVMLAETRQLKTKWEKTGLLEGMKEREQHSMAVLLENQAKQLLDEATQTGTSAGSEEWSGVALPLVRRIFGEIAAKEFVSVQPMNLPSGLIFFLDFKVNDTAVSVAGNTVGTGSLVGIGYDSEVSASAGLFLRTIAVPTASLVGADLEAVKSFALSGSAAAAITEVYNQFTAVIGGNVVFYVKANPAAGGATAAVNVNFSTQPVSYNRGDFEDTNAGVVGSDINIPEIDLELKSEAIVAKTRKLKAVWTPELAQDLNAYHSIDAEAELTSMLSDYISLEIDLEILDMLKANALTTEYWSTNVGEELVGGAWSNIGGASNAYTKNAWFQTLGVKINKVSNKIHQLTLRGGANFLVASPDVCTILESIPGFVVNADKDAAQFAAGVTAVGSMSNRYTVYKNPYMTSNEILMGYRGNNFLETGAVYAPYVPLIMTPLVYDPQNFTPRRGVMTRYAKKMVRPEYYGKIFIKDLATI